MEAILVKKYCRFGNNIYQLHNAIAFARHFGIKKIYINEFAFLEQSVLSDGIEMIRDNPNKHEKVFEHKFFYAHELPASGFYLYDADSKAIFKELVQNVLKYNKIKKTNELYIHIRSGDIFTRRKPKWNYIQPPLAYYQKIIQDRNPSGVVVVFENYKNPTIEPLIAWLYDNKINHRIQSSVIFKDVKQLLRAKTIVAGKGSFAPIIACLGSAEEIIVFRRPDIPALLEKCGVKIISYHDADGEYIKKWQISALCGEEHDRQLKQMIEYPIENIRLYEEE